jgi:hypothetical protein
MAIASFQSVNGITTIPIAGGTSLPVFVGSSSASGVNPYVVAQIVVPSGTGGTLLLSGFTGTFGAPIISNLTIEGPAKLYFAGGGATAVGTLIQKLSFGPGVSGASFL